MAFSINDIEGNPLTLLDFGEVYYCSKFMTSKKVVISNKTDSQLQVSVLGTSVADGYSLDIKMIVVDCTDDMDAEDVQMLLELPQEDIYVPSHSEVSVGVYITNMMNSCSEVGQRKFNSTSFVRTSFSMTVRGNYCNNALDVVLAGRVALCTSLFSVDDNDIEFDSCIVGNTYVRDLQIWNRSECILHYRIVPAIGKEGGNLPVSLSDFETGKIVNMYQCLSIPAFSSQRVRITLKATVPCDITRSIRIVNDYNSSNIALLNCRISVTAKNEADGISIESKSGLQVGVGGQFLDFGDCYDGVETVHCVWIKNNSDDAVEVTTSSDCPDEVSFDMLERLVDKSVAHLPRTTDIEPAIRSSINAPKASISAFDSDSSKRNSFSPERTSGSSRYQTQTSRMYRKDNAIVNIDSRNEMAYIDSGKSNTESSKSMERSINRQQSFSQPQRSKSRSHPNSYFVLDEYSGDFDNSDDCPGSQFGLQRFFLNEGVYYRYNACRADAHGSDLSPSNKSHLQTQPKSRESGTFLIPPGNRTPVYIRYMPLIQPNSLENVKRDSAQHLSPYGNTFASVRDTQPSSVSRRIGSQLVDVGSLVKKTVKITLAWKYVSRNNPERYDTKQRQKMFRKTLQCRSRCCTSIISAQPTVLDLGECHVGDLKSASLVIKNESELPALVLPFVDSSCLEIMEREMFIPPRQSRQCHLEFIARAIDDKYRETVNFINVFNSHCNLTVDVKAKNFDAHQILEHSTFYKLYTRGNQKQLQLLFDKCICNMPNVRLFSIRNMHQFPLRFEISVSQSSDVEIYLLSPRVSDSDEDLTKKRSAFSRRRRNILSDDGTSSTTAHSKTLKIEDLKWGGVKKKRPSTRSTSLGGMISSRHRSFDGVDVPSLLCETGEINEIRGADEGYMSDGHTSVNPNLSDLFADTSSVRNSAGMKDAAPPSASMENSEFMIQDRDFTELMDVPGFPFSVLKEYYETENSQDDTSTIGKEKIKESISIVKQCYSDLAEELRTGNRLLPLCTSTIFNSVTVPKGETYDFVVIFTPHNIPPRSESGVDDDSPQIVQHEIKLHLVEYTDSTGGASTSGLKSRSLPLRAQLYQSEMVVIQKNINFGKIKVGEFSTKGLSVTNKSSVPLLYSISKSGSISSGFLSVQTGRKGIIAPLATKTIEFAFKPTLHGAFEETLSIENVLNSKNSQSVVIKANVLKAQLFSLVSCDKGEVDKDAALSVPQEDATDISKNKFKDDIVNYMLIKNNEKAQDSVVITPFFLGVVPSSHSCEFHFQFKIINLSYKPRVFVIATDDVGIVPDLDTGFDFVTTTCVKCSCSFMDRKSAGMNRGLVSSGELSREERKHLEDKIEHYSQKLKIAIRKNKPDKKEKYEKKIEDIKSKLSNHNVKGTGIEDSMLKDDIDQTSLTDSVDSIQSNVPKLLLTTGNSEDLRSNFALVGKDESFSVMLKQEECITVSVHVTYSAKELNHELGLEKIPVVGCLKVYESKNEDDVKSIFFGLGLENSGINAETSEVIYESPVRKTGNFDSLTTNRGSYDAESDHATIRDTNVSLLKPPRFSVEIEPLFACIYNKTPPMRKSAWGMLIKDGVKLVLDSATPASMYAEFSVTSLSSVDADLCVWTENLSPLFDSSQYFMLSSSLYCSDMQISLNLRDQRIVRCISGDSTWKIHMKIRPGDAVKCRISWTGILTDSIPLPLLEFIFVSVGDISDSDFTPSSRILPVMLTNVKKSFSVDERHIMLEVPVGSSCQRTVQLKNLSEWEVIHYTSLVTFSGQSDVGCLRIADNQTGLIQPGDSVSLSIFFFGYGVGKYENTILIRNIADSFDYIRIVVSSLVGIRQSCFVRYPDLNLDESGKSYKLDLGLIQLPLQHSKNADFEVKYPLRVLNVGKDILYVTAVSNLKKQCLIYRDSICSALVDKYPILPFEITTLFIVIRPSNMSNEISESGRELVGGIRLVFSARSITDYTDTHDQRVDANDNARKLFESSIIFKALIGRSRFRIANKSIKFCCKSIMSSSTRGIGVIKGRFVVENSSPIFPLYYTLKDCDSRSEKYFSAGDIRANTAQFSIVDGYQGIIDPGSKNALTFMAYFGCSSGLVIKTMKLVNTFTHECEVLEFSFFLDDGSLFTCHPSFLPPAEGTQLRDSAIFSARGIAGTSDVTPSNLLYMRGLFVTNLDNNHINCPLWIAPCDNVVSPRQQKIRLVSDSPVCIPEVISSPTVYIVTGCQQHVLLRWQLKNPHKSPIRVSPASDLPVSVCIESQSSSAQGMQTTGTIKNITWGNTPVKRNVKHKSSLGDDQSRSMMSIPKDLIQRGFTICGDAVTILPHETVTVTLSCKKGCSISTLKLAPTSDESIAFEDIFLNGAVLLISAAQSLESFFNPTKSYHQESCYTTASEFEVLPILSYTSVTTHFVVPRLKLRTTRFMLGNLKIYKPHFFSVPVENTSIVAITFRVENIPSWMSFCPSSDGCSSKGKSQKGNKVGSVTLSAAPKGLTHIEFRIDIPRSQEVDFYEHTLRIRNLSLSQSSKHVVRDSASIDVSFTADKLNPILVKDAVGVPLSFGHTGNPCVSVDSVNVPGSKGAEEDLNSRCAQRVVSTYLYNNTTDTIRVKPMIRLLPMLADVIHIDLKVRDGVDAEFHLLPAEQSEISIMVSSYPSSRITEDILDSLSTYSSNDDVVDDDGLSSDGSFDSTHQSMQSIGPALFGHVVLEFATFPLQSHSSRPSRCGTDNSLDLKSLTYDSIAIDIVSCINVIPTLQCSSNTYIGITAYLDDDLPDSSADSLVWKCSTQSPPITLSTRYESFLIHNPSSSSTNISIKCLSVWNVHRKFSVDMNEANRERVEDFVALEDLIPVVEPSSGTINPGEDFLCSVAMKVVAAPVELSGDVLELLSKIAPLRPQFAKELLSGDDIIYTMLLAICDVAYEIHPPLLCPVFVKLEHRKSTTQLPLSQEMSLLYGIDGEESTYISRDEVATVDSHSKPILYLRGVSPCGPLNMQYEINLGQREQQSGESEWLLSLENMSKVTSLRYRIYCLGPDDSKWLVIAQSGGEIGPSGCSSLVLHFVLANVGMFSTYLIIENLSNSCDTRVVRVSLQVVQDWRRKMQVTESTSGQATSLFNIEASHIVMDTERFDSCIDMWNTENLSSEVLHEHRSKLNWTDHLPENTRSFKSFPSVVDFGEVFVGQCYTRRSFIINNTSDIPLDFQISSSFSPDELDFSVTPVFPRTSNVVTLRPYERRFIYVVFKPPYIDVEPNTRSPTSLGNADVDCRRSMSWRVEGSIFVSCKLVKNHHETICVYAKCSLPRFSTFIVDSELKEHRGEECSGYILQLGVPTCERAEDKYVLSERHRISDDTFNVGSGSSWRTVNTVGLKNISDPPSPLLITIYHCMQSLFRLDVYVSGDSSTYNFADCNSLPWKEMKSDDRGGNTLTIKIEMHEVVFLRVAYDVEMCCFDIGKNKSVAEDHFMVYNGYNSSEKCRIPVRLLQSHTDSSEKDPTSVSMSLSDEVPLSFSGLEGTIISYLKFFSSFWLEVFSMKFDGLHQGRTDVSDATFAVRHGHDTGVSLSDDRKTEVYLNPGSRKILHLLDMFFTRLRLFVTLTDHSALLKEVQSELYLRSFPDESDLFVKMNALASKYVDMCFHFNAITDMLVLHTMRQSSHGHEIMSSARTGLPVSRLALLLYTVVFRHQVFELYSRKLYSGSSMDGNGVCSVLPPPLFPFVRQFLYYLSFFPDKTDEIAPLFSIWQKL